tara:strand:+ start:235 stop:942 length:708 start_codon:yes stop_codon:yes gene_type:complete
LKHQIKQNNIQVLMDIIESFAYSKKQYNKEPIKKKQKTEVDFFDIDTTDFKSPNVLVFDVETTSLSGSVIQLGWILADACGNILNQKQTYYNLSDGEKISYEAQKLHKITETQLHQEGISAKNIQNFIQLCEVAIENGCTLVAHNSRFDVQRINYTASLNDLTSKISHDQVFCTMKNSTSRCGLIKVDGKTKFPTNAELYNFLFRQEPEEKLHNALEDCKVTLKSFIEGRNRGWW